MCEPRPSAPPAGLRHLPLDALELAPENVRSTPAGAGADAENAVRAAMHPADQAVAFRALADAGATAAAIAARFGVSEHTVAQRLRLGNAAPELLDAHRADEVDLKTLAAFTVTTDHARQRAVWEALRGQGYRRPGPWQVKRRLTEGRMPAGAAIAFLGHEVDAGVTPEKSGRDATHSDQSHTVGKRSRVERVGTASPSR